MHRSVEVQDLGANLVACDDLEGSSRAPAAPWTGWHGHCHDGVHREPREAPRGIDPAFGGVPGSRQQQYPSVPVALVAPLPHPAPHGWSQSRDIPEISQLCPAWGLCSQHLHQDPPAGVSASRRGPAERLHEVCPGPPNPAPIPGIPGGSGSGRASQAPCAAAPCAEMFSQSRRAAESRIITGNVPGGERGAAWGRGHLHGPGTALLGAGMGQEGPFAPGPASPPGPPGLVPAWPHTSFRELPRFSRPEVPRHGATAP